MIALALGAPAPARGDIDAPFTEWFQSLADSAQALADGDAARAEGLSRGALAVRPRGPAAERATLALGLSLLKRGRSAEAEPLLAASASSLEPQLREDLRQAFAATPAARPAPPAPSPTPDVTRDAETRLAHAERLVVEARPREALAAIDSAAGAALSPEQRQRAQLLRAWALLQLGRREDAEELARHVVASEGAGEGTRVGAELVIARVAARTRRFADAIARYDALAARSAVPVPGLTASASAELPGEAAYLAAWLPFDAGQWRRAAEALSRFAAQRPRSPRATDARWFAAWSLFRDGRRGEARAAWARLERTPLAPAALYWQARLSPAARARQLYRRCIEAEPGGWYAFLSATRLRALGVRASALPDAIAPAAAVEEVSPAVADAMARATSLLGLGLRDAAAAILRGAVTAPCARASAPQLAELSDAAGEAELALRIARDQLPLSRRALRWQHPLAFGAGLDALAGTTGVDPLLFRALIRRESVFRESARSPAGAEGLVQLMPYTADRLATLLGEPAGAPPPELRDPATSLALGAAYLGLLLERFGDPAGALAAYNGGPAPMAAWATAHAGRNLDEAVEELPFRETRRYVKAVMAAYGTYRHLHAGAPAAIDGLRKVKPPRPGVEF